MALDYYTRCLYRFLIQHMYGILVKIWDTISVFIMHSLQTTQVYKFAQFNAELYASVNVPLNSGSSFVTMSFLDYSDIDSFRSSTIPVHF